MRTFATMTILRDITDVAPRNEALVRVYKNQVSLNSAAAQALGLDDQSKISVRVGDDDCVYISKRAYASYALAQWGKTYRIRSVALSRSLAERLQGFGTYRIETEDPIKDYNGDVCYRIFPRKFK